MEILDDDILEQILNLNEIKVSFQEYKSEIIQESLFLFVSGFLLLIGSGSFFMMAVETPSLLLQSLFILMFGFGLCATFGIFYFLRNTMIDIFRQKLSIKSDIFMDANVIQSEDSVQSTILEINLLENGILHIPSKRKRKIATGTAVYIVQTKAAKIVLDIIPQDYIK